MWLRIADQYKVIGTTRILTRHRVLPGSMSTDPKRMLTSRLAVLARFIGAEPCDRFDSESLRRRAYGRAYLGSTVEYLQVGDQELAYTSFCNMARICPELLHEVDTFYQLGLGTQPKGSLGDFESLDMAHNSELLIGLLDRLFVDPRLSTDLADESRGAYATAYFVLGKLFYGIGDLKQSRSLLRRAVTYAPGQALNWELQATLVKAYAGKSGLALLRRMRHASISAKFAFAGLFCLAEGIA
jgi:hypothetical protein